jgi:hypothetical protein
MSRPSRFTRGKTRYLLYKKMGGPKTGLDDAENLTPPGFDPRTVQPVASRYTDWTILAHTYYNTDVFISSSTYSYQIKSTQLYVTYIDIKNH